MNPDPKLNEIKQTKNAVYFVHFAQFTPDYENQRAGLIEITLGVNI